MKTCPGEIFLSLFVDFWAVLLIEWRLSAQPNNLTLVQKLLQQLLHDGFTILAAVDVCDSRLLTSWSLTSSSSSCFHSKSFPPEGQSLLFVSTQGEKKRYISCVSVWRTSNLCVASKRLRYPPALPSGVLSLPGRTVGPLESVGQPTEAWSPTCEYQLVPHVSYPVI